METCFVFVRFCFYHFPVRTARSKSALTQTIKHSLLELSTAATFEYVFDRNMTEMPTLAAPLPSLSGSVPGADSVMRGCLCKPGSVVATRRNTDIF